jgi:hypothetical protein
MCPLKASIKNILFIKMMKSQDDGEYSKDILLYLISGGDFFHNWSNKSI